MILALVFAERVSRFDAAATCVQDNSYMQLTERVGLVRIPWTG